MPRTVSRSTTRAGAPTATRHTIRSAARTIRLRPGDTLWELAHHYGNCRRAATSQPPRRLHADLRQKPPGHPGVRPPGHPLQQPPPVAPGAAGRVRHRRRGVAFARGQLNLPYHWDGSGAGGYDRSGLVQAAWRAAGVTLPRTTTAQVRAGIRITRTQLEPGDLVFTDGYRHVQFHLGHGRVIEAARPGTRVRTARLPPASLVDAYRRPTAANRTTHITRATGHHPTTIATGSNRRAAAAVFASQYPCASHIITRESGWRATAAHPASGAYGLAQALPGSKTARYGTDWRTPPTTQLLWMRACMGARYGSACNAWTFWQTHHWY